MITSSRYLTMDTKTIREAMEADALAQISTIHAGAAQSLPIVLDEVQRVPDVSLALKQIVDVHPQAGQFLLTGSADIFTYSKAVDSLAGRVLTLTLRPLSAGETMRAGPAGILDAALASSPVSVLPAPVPYSRNDAIELMVRGGFPEIRSLDGRNRADRYSSYLDSIVERDVAGLFPVRKPENLRRMIDQIAGRTGNELNVTNLCSDLGIKNETATAYLDALIKLGVVHLLGSWASGEASREIRRPKIHMLDTGVATALRGEDAYSYDLSANPAALGSVLETFAFNELEKSLPYQADRWRLYHWRHRNGREIDIVAEAPQRRLALFEMKAAGEVVADDFKHCDWFLGPEGPASAYNGVAFVVYLGSDVVSFGSGKIALPLSMFWSFPLTDRTDRGRKRP